MADNYHSKRGYNFTAHMLMDLLNGKTMEEVFQFPVVDSDAYHFGEAVHTYIWEGQNAFNDKYVVGGPINERTGNTYKRKSKAYQTWLAEQSPGIKAITNTDWYLLRKMADAVWCPIWPNGTRQLLKGGTAEVTLRGSYGGFPCQSRLDWVTPHPYIVDLKTCADISTFGLSIMQYRYRNQMAFYREMFKYQWKTPVYLIAVDKQETPSCIVERLTTRQLDEAQEENEAKMEEVKEEFFAYRSEFIARKKEEEVCQLMQA